MYAIVASCSEKKAPLMSIAQQNAIVDSIVKAERKELMILEQERLKDRMSIELKERVDSILNERQPIVPNILMIPNSDTATFTEPTDTASPPASL